MNSLLIDAHVQHDTQAGLARLDLVAQSSVCFYLKMSIAMNNLREYLDLQLDSFLYVVFLHPSMSLYLSQRCSLWWVNT